MAAEIRGKMLYEQAMAEVNALREDREHSSRPSTANCASEDRLDLARRQAVRAFEIWRHQLSATGGSAPDA
jgi:hypothetical protein